MSPRHSTLLAGATRLHGMADNDELATGYGPGTPVGDNLCNDFQRETAGSYAELARARGDRLQAGDGGLTLTDSELPLPFWNRAVLHQPVTDVATTVGRVKEFYAAAPAPHAPFLLDSAWPTPDLREHGLTLMGHPPLMVRRADLDLPPAPPELRIVEATDAHLAGDLERTLIDGYPAPPMQPFETVRLFTPAAFAAEGWHHFVGYVDEQPVAAGSCFVGDRLLRVENIATLESVRGRGYGVAITAATLAAAPKTAVLVASDLGRPIYEKLGFAAVLRVTYWLGMR